MTEYGKGKKRSRRTPPVANIICCLIDRSASTIDMAGAPIFEMKKQIDILRNNSSKSNVDIRFTLASFNDNIEFLMINKSLINEPTPKREKFIELLRPKGRSKLYTSILKSLTMLEGHRQEYLKDLPASVSKLDPEVAISLIVLTDNIDIERNRELSEEVRSSLRKGFCNGLRFKIIIANSYTKNIKRDLDLKTSHIIQTECNYTSIKNTLKKLNNIIKNIDTEYNYI